MSDTLTYARLAMEYYLSTIRRLVYRNQYLYTEHWRRTRAAKLSQTPACEYCGTTHQLDVHHKHYDTLGYERLSDLVVLCRYCHEQEHKNG